MSKIAPIGMTKTKMDILYAEYIQARFLMINKEQFVYMAHLLPSCIIVMSDGLLSNDEWIVFKRISKILADELATDDLGTDEKKENLMLIFKSEIRYLLKNREKWEAKFLAALKDYRPDNEELREFLEETMELFAPLDQHNSEVQLQTYQRLKNELQL